MDDRISSTLSFSYGRPCISFRNFKSSSYISARFSGEMPASFLTATRLYQPENILCRRGRSSTPRLTLPDSISTSPVKRGGVCVCVCVERAVCICEGRGFCVCVCVCVCGEGRVHM